MATGAFESIVIGGRRFATKADDSVETLLKGKTNETIMHGDGSFHNKKEWHPGHITGLNIIVDDMKQDKQFLQNLQDGADLIAITATKVSGVVISGEVQIIDELACDESEGTIELNLEGDIEEL